MHFFDSYYEAGADLPPEEQDKYYAAIIKYFYTGEDPELDGMAGTLWKLTKPTVDTSRKRSESGKLGGAPEGNCNAQKTSKKQAKNKQTPPFLYPYPLKRL